MKNRHFLILLFPALLFSCTKNEPVKCSYTTPSKVATTAEINYLQGYITANNIVATQHASGVFYSIINPGTGSSPTVCSNITVKYIGSILGGMVFDSNTTVTGVKFELGRLILGWQSVLPVLRTGGKITLYIPPTLGYGPSAINDNNGNILIPSNSYLIFEIELLDVQ